LRRPSTSRARFGRRGAEIAARGFTLIELMIVVAIVALASAMVALSIRDPAATRLEEEAVRLASLLESARAEARASGLKVRFIPGSGSSAGTGGAETDRIDFRFDGLPRTVVLPQRFLDPATTAEVAGANALLLGPEPLIGPQRIVLRLADRRLDIVTDGLGPFAVPADDTVARPAL
jgi:general secretion pathway protein H